MKNHAFGSRLTIAALVSTWLALAASAQVTPAAGYTPPDDTPSFKVGATPHNAAMRSMELMMTEVRPRVERALGSLAREAAE